MRPAGGEHAFVGELGERLESLLGEFAALLADALAPRLAAVLSETTAHEGTQPPLRRLLTLDQLVERLPAGRTAATWKRWLYERTRHGAVPGCHKIGGRLYFDHEHTIPWLAAGGLELTAEQSLDAAAMPTPTNDRPVGG